MSSSNHALRVERVKPYPTYEQTPTTVLEPQPGASPAAPRLVRPVQKVDGRDIEQSLLMYTEERVAEMLQVSLSQLRKWRLKQHLLGPDSMIVGIK
jgi:hypothetical protein